MKNYNDFANYDEYCFDGKWMGEKEIIHLMKNLNPDISEKDFYKYMNRVVEEDERPKISNDILEPSNAMLTEFLERRVNKKPYDNIDKIIQSFLVYKLPPNCYDENTVYAATGISLKGLLDSIKKEKEEFEESIMRNNRDMEEFQELIMRNNRDMEEFYENRKEKLKEFEEIIKKIMGANILDMDAFDYSKPVKRINL